MSKPMSLGEACTWIGWGNSEANRKRLRRHAEAVEKQTGARVLIRRKGAQRTRYGLTRRIVHDHMPELLTSSYDRTERRVRKTLLRIETDLDARVDDRIETHPTITRLQVQSEKTVEMVEQLANIVEKSTILVKDTEGHRGTN
jgi:ABC-type phosphate transport system auxiliary subunit